VTGSSRRDVIADGDSMGRSWKGLADSKVTTFRTIAEGEIGGTPVCVKGKSPRDKITDALVVAPIAHATNTTKTWERSRRTGANSELEFALNRITPFRSTQAVRKKSLLRLYTLGILSDCRGA
jgi:hypothetical protein